MSKKKWIKDFFQFSLWNSAQVGIRAKLFSGISCEWLVWPSVEFGEGFRISGLKKRGRSGEAKNLRSEAMTKWGNGEMMCPSDRRSSRWWAIYELEKYGKKIDFSPRIITETNQLTLILRSKWKLGSVKLLFSFFRKIRVPKSGRCWKAPVSTHS